MFECLAYYMQNFSIRIPEFLAYYRFLTCLNFQNLQYYLEKNLDARQRELEREAELEDKAPKVKAKSSPR